MFTCILLISPGVGAFEQLFGPVRGKFEAKFSKNSNAPGGCWSFDLTGTLGPKIRTSKQAQSGIRAKINSWSTTQCVFKIHDLPQKSIIRMHFKATSVDPITYSPPPGVVKPMEAISEALFFRPLFSPKQSWKRIKSRPFIPLSKIYILYQKYLKKK